VFSGLEKKLGSSWWMNFQWKDTRIRQKKSFALGFARPLTGGALPLKEAFGGHYGYGWWVAMNSHDEIWGGV